VTTRRRVVPLLVVALFALGCSSPAHQRVSAGRATRHPTTTAAPTTTTTTAPPATIPVPPTTAAGPSTTPTTRAVARPAAPPTRLIDQIADTGGATKVMTVDSPSWASDTATMILWQREGSAWVQVAGPWSAWVGAAGWAYAPGESTDRSPIGSFPFGTGFGTAANPGYGLGWFVIDPNDYWVEDPSSAQYNTHQVGPADESQAPWGHFERLVDQPVAYEYAALIDFNVPANGPRGSGIFLHASKGAATAGCVSLPVGELLTALRWIDRGTRIVMGPDSEIRKL
jgi:L,D-peptidoglycan transpeptidase YkuD (ErfK/YbiS/YcfS/YnhG family)